MAVFQVPTVMGILVLGGWNQVKVMGAVLLGGSEGLGKRIGNLSGVVHCVRATFKPVNISFDK